MGTNDLLVADLEVYPHLLMAGTRGSGKTRFGLRPLIASALTSGRWQVAIYDRSGWIFCLSSSIPMPMPCCLVTHLTLLIILHHYAKLFKDDLLPCAGPSAPPTPRILAIMDEFANLADALPTNERWELWRGTRMIAVEGRKADVHLALALQDPTHKSLDLRIRRNCLPLSFLVKDGDASRVVLGAGGAEQLPLSQFMTVTGHLLHGVAFAPSDEEISSFLAARPVASYPATS